MFVELQCARPLLPLWLLSHDCLLCSHQASEVQEPWHPQLYLLNDFP